MNHIKTFDPRILLGDRLGLTFYRMITNAYLNNDVSHLEKLYKKFIGYFPGEKRIHNMSIFIKLIESIQSNGFNSKFPVNANPNEHCLSDGSHRCAIAMSLNITEIPYSLKFEDNGIEEIFFESKFKTEFYWAYSSTHFYTM